MPLSISRQRQVNLCVFKARLELCATESVPGQPRPYREILSRKTRNVCLHAYICGMGVPRLPACIHMCMGVPHAPEDQRTSLDLPEPEFQAGSCELLCGKWKVNLDSLKAAEPSLQRL